MDKEQIKKGWEKYAKKANLEINPDEKIVDMLAEGVLNNLNKLGYWLCPCRMSLGNKEDDANHICPCDFQKHDIWETKGQCFCGLFLKKE